MNVENIIFWILAVVSIIASLWMVSTRNAVRSALFLVLTFLCMAVFYILLSAQFIAAVQVIVYAGAIMVLFLFVIMLLNLSAPQALKEKGGFQARVSVLLGVGFIAALFSTGFTMTFQTTKTASDLYNLRLIPDNPDMPNVVLPENIGTVETIGRHLFHPSQPWLFPFELTSILLLVAVIGAIILAKRNV